MHEMLSDDALLEELLTILEDADSEEVSSTRLYNASDSRWPSEASSSQPQRSTHQRSLKRRLDALRLEASQLTQTLESLRLEASSSASSSKEVALTERYKRRRAEDERQRLREVVNSQTQFLRGLRSVFSSPPSFALELNLYQQLHNYTRLPRDPSRRWLEYSSLAQDLRLHTAKEILLRETDSLLRDEGVECLPPATATCHVTSTVSDLRDGFAVTTTSAYALESLDTSALMRGACVAVSEVVVRCVSYDCHALRKQIVDPETAACSKILYHVLDIQQKSRVAADEVLVESRVVTQYKETDDFAIVLWDFVDHDELYPTNQQADITRQAVGGCLLRRELCADGVERVVARTMSTRMYRFHDRGRPERLERYQKTSTPASARAYEMLFRTIMLDSVAKEQAAYARTAPLLRVERHL